MKKEIDCRGLACPAPVLKTKEATEQEDAQIITIVVDNDAAVENVSRFMMSKGLDVSVESRENGISAVSGVKTGQTGQSQEQEINHAQTEQDRSSAHHQKIMVMIGSSTIGRGDDELGRKLMLSYIKTLKEMGEDLWRLVFVNEGVKFAIKESPLLSEIKAFEDEGLHILVCGTCLTHFNLLEEKAVGETTNMLDIVTAMQLAEKVINL
ncbi:MAG: sulfurtransferase-like selenium metabolism protein YedF [Thermodesulfobacteriota bacterium]|nr:sulfurtransferase-like selenium metabolism protein YedF [Thermodesulfobacteriota bacterium]